MKKTFFIIVMMLVVQGQGVAYEISGIADAVNVAGKQRMYTMRMLRDYIMIGTHLHFEDPVADLKHTLHDFEVSHMALKAYIQDPKLVAELAKIEKHWDTIKATMKQPPVQDQAASYAKNAIAFREMLNDFTNHLAKTSGKTESEAVNHSGRLRAVSQAIAAVYMLRIWDVPGSQKKMRIPMERFRSSLDYLRAAKTTKEPMKKVLAKLEKIYLFMDVINQFSDMEPSLVIEKTNTMLELSNTLTQLYVKAH